MNFARTIIFLGLILVGSSSPSQACGGHQARCRGHRHHRQPVAMMQPAYAPVAAPMSMTYSTPQMAQATTQAATSPVAVANPAVAGIQPTYEYSASPSGQPAYYYTYDNSGKIIVAQWMDWVFRGGLAAGAPAPPLPIIGALRNR